jgi:hypothetical protein
MAKRENLVGNTYGEYAVLVPVGAEVETTTPAAAQQFEETDLLIFNKG